MRAFLLALIAATAVPVATPAAQSSAELERRIERLEDELRDQRRRGSRDKDEAERLIQPEITSAPAPAPGAAATGPAETPITTLIERVNALERAQQGLTAQIEQQGFRLRQLDESMTKFRQDAEFRLGQLEEGTAGQPAADAATGVAAPAPGTPFTLATPAPGSATPTATEPATPAAAPPPTPAQSTPATVAPAQPAPAEPTAPQPAPAEPAAPPPASAEDQYRAAYALVDARRWPEAQAALADFLAKHPESPRASHARYWLGRTYYAQNDFERSARTHFDNYKANARGERAQESLYWVGQSLVQLDRPKEACQVYELATKVYADEMKPALKPQFTSARAEAGCPA